MLFLLGHNMVESWCNAKHFWTENVKIVQLKTEVATLYSVTVWPDQDRQCAVSEQCGDRRGSSEAGKRKKCGACSSRWIAEGESHGCAECEGTSPVLQPPSTLICCLCARGRCDESRAGNASITQNSTDCGRSLQSWSMITYFDKADLKTSSACLERLTQMVQLLWQMQYMQNECWCGGRIVFSFSVFEYFIAAYI